MTHVTRTNQALKLPIRPMLLRAVLVAGVLGSALTLINQPGAVFGADEFQILRLVLVYLTPFLVVAFSQGLGIWAAQNVSGSLREFREPFRETLFSHGIPLRAIALGLTMGSANTAIVAVATLLAGQGLDQLPIALILQALTLPVLFGALSQTVSFRRTISQLAGRQVGEALL